MKMSGLALGIDFTYFFLGYTLIGYVIIRFFFKRKSQNIPFFLSFILGQSFFYIYCLTTLPLSFAKYVPLPFCIYFFYYYFKNFSVLKFTYREISIPTLLLTASFFLFSFIFIKAIILDPIYQWDAICIWYYHAKQIFYADGINKGAGFLLRNIHNDNAHPFYPMYSSCISAYFANSLGYWNQYYPKLNLMVHLFGVLLALISLKNINFILRIAFCYIIFSYNVFWIHSGYMDIWVGIYFGISFLFFINYIHSKSSIDMITFLCSMLFLLNFKREGIMINFTLFIVLVPLFFLIYYKTKTLKHAFLSFRKNFFFIALFIIPFSMWAFLKQIWGVIGYSDFKFSKILNVNYFIDQMSSWRFSHAYDGFITNYDIVNMFSLVTITIILSFCYLWFIKSPAIVIKDFFTASIIPLIAFVLYVSIIIVSYVAAMEPDQDMKFYIETSSMRIFSSYFMFLVGAFFSISLSFFNVLENKSYKVLKTKISTQAKSKK